MIIHYVNYNIIVSKIEKAIKEAHVSYVIPTFWYRIELDPIWSKFRTGNTGKL